jgi:hypothetical protein
MFAKLFSCLCVKREVKSETFMPLSLLCTVNDESTQTEKEEVVVAIPVNTDVNTPVIHSSPPKQTQDSSTQTTETAFRIVDYESIHKFIRRYMRITLDERDSIFGRDILHKYHAIHEDKIYFKDVRDILKTFAGVNLVKSSVGYQFKGIRWRKLS